jgi:nucleotide-binding universal stress UspA family protein
MTTVAAGTRITLKNILFATDFSPCSNAALPYAISIARQYGAKLYAAHVIACDAHLLLAPEAWPALSLQEEERVWGQFARLEEVLEGIPHSVLVRSGDAGKVLSALVKEQEIDCLVVGTHGRTGFQKFLVGSVAEEIFRHASCPVLTVGPQVRFKTEAPPEFKHIVFATDFSDASLAGLPFALSLAEENEAQLALLHILEHAGLRGVDQESDAAFLLQRLRDLVPPEVEPWCDTACFVEHGYAADQILEFARNRNADLIVLGVRPIAGKLDVTQHLAKNTAYKVVSSAICPVLTVRGA